MTRIKLALLHAGVGNIAKSHVGSGGQIGRTPWPIAREVGALYSYVLPHVPSAPTAEKVKQEAIDRGGQGLRRGSREGPKDSVDTTRLDSSCRSRIDKPLRRKSSVGQALRECFAASFSSLEFPRLDRRRGSPRDLVSKTRLSRPPRSSCKNRWVRLPPEKLSRIFALADELREDEGNYVSPKEIAPEGHRDADGGFDLMPAGRSR